MSDSRAIVPESVDERVAYIAEEMRELRWERGKTAKLLAVEWGVPDSTIRNYSAEAHRQVMAEVNADEAGRETGLALRRVMHEALEAGDRGSVIRAAETWATLVGAKAPTKVSAEVSSVGLDELDALRKAAQANECSSSEPQKPPGESEPNS